MRTRSVRYCIDEPYVKLRTSQSVLLTGPTAVTYSTAAVRSTSERQLQRKLNDARSARGDVPLGRSRVGQRLGDSAIVPVSEAGSRVVEHGVVEDVEEFSAELQVDPLTRERDLLK